MGDKDRMAAKAGDKYTLHGEEKEVKESCGGKRGKWYCLTHNHIPDNNFTKDLHCGDTKEICKMAWLCLDCGNVEVP